MIAECGAGSPPKDARRREKDHEVERAESRFQGLGPLSPIRYVDSGQVQDPMSELEA